MSTVFYGFKAKDESDLQRMVRSAKRYAAKWPAFVKSEGIEFQVFDTSVGLVIRILENGYGLKNKFWGNSRMRQINYDNRGDAPASWQKNLKVALEIDELITAKNYRIIPIYPRGLENINIHE